MFGNSYQTPNIVSDFGSEAPNEQDNVSVQSSLKDPKVVRINSAQSKRSSKQYSEQQHDQKSIVSQSSKFNQKTISNQSQTALLHNKQDNDKISPEKLEAYQKAEQILHQNQTQMQQQKNKKNLKHLGIDQRIFTLQHKDLQDVESVLVCQNLTKKFNLMGREDQVIALNNITLIENSDFEPIRRGEFLMVRGPSGGGKTTFLNMLGTIDMPTSGTIKILGDQIDEKSTDAYLSQLRLQKIGFVFQTFNLLATMTAYENVELPMRVNNKLTEKEMRKRVQNLLTRVGLQDRMEHLPSELSGGEQQRVAIARALANSPQLLLLDEPTGDLDTKNTVEIMNLLLSINNFGYSQEDDQKVTMVMVTHNPDLECYADRIVYFRDGAIIKQCYNEVQSPLDWDNYVDYLNSQN